MNSRYMTWILFEAIDEIIDQGVLNDKKIVLFGLNAPAFACKQYIQDKGYEVYSYVDNSASAVQLFNNDSAEPTFHHLAGDRRIRAYAPGGLPAEYREEYVFLLYSKYEAEMLSQLAAMGYAEGVQAFVMGGFWKTEEVMKAYVPERAGRTLIWEEEKARQIEAVKYVQALCEKHGLRIFIHYGTLIGAVRHNGYIPWDDDMDLCMPTADLHRLIRILQEENGRYGVYYAACSKPCRHFIAKIEDRQTLMHQWDIPIELIGGMVIDIFPLGGLPGGHAEAMAFYEETTRLSWEYDNLVVEFPNANEAMAARRDALREELLARLERYPFEESAYVFTIPDKPGSPRVYPRHIWDGRVPMRFEGETFYGPAGYDEFLRLHYGDYLSLPPENRRVSIHRNRVFELLDATGCEKQGVSSLRGEGTREKLALSEPNRSGNCKVQVSEIVPVDARKKLLCYLSVSDYFAYGELALAKLRHMVQVFTESKDALFVCLVTEDALEEMLAREQADVYREVQELMRTLVSDGVAVRIPYALAEEAANGCDAFYGAPGELLWKCKDLGMPVMIRDVHV